LALVRLLDFALLTFLVWLVWSQVIRGWRAASAAASRAAQPPRSSAGTAEGAARQPAAVPLERCDRCGVYVPAGHMLPGTAGEVFCSESCRAGGARQTS
jgi:hypothetical protein